MQYRLLVVFALVVFLGLYSSVVLAQDDSAAQDQYDAQEAACLPEEEEVEVFTGTQDVVTDEFEITGAEWRFISEIRPRTVTTGSMDVDAFDENGFSVGFTTQLVFPDERFHRQSSGVIDGPGTFTLEIEANGVDYEIIVCQAPGGDPQPDPDPSPGPDPDPTDDKRGPQHEVIVGIPEGKVLANTGGFPLATLFALGMIGGGIALIRRT